MPLDVAVDAVGTKVSINGVTTVSYSGLTIGAVSNLALLVSISFQSDPGAISVARWDDGGTNQNLVQLVSLTATTGQVARLYGLRNPTPGNKTLTITWTNSLEFGMNAMSFKNVNQDSDAEAFPYTLAYQLGVNSNSNIDIPRPAYGAVVSCVGGGTGNAIVSTGPNQWWTQSGGTPWEGGGAYSTTSGLLTSVWSTGGPVTAVAAAIGPLDDTVNPPSNQREFSPIAWTQRMETDA